MHDPLLTDWLSDNFKSRDASASKNATEEKEKKKKEERQLQCNGQGGSVSLGKKIAQSCKIDEDTGR